MITINSGKYNDTHIPIKDLGDYLPKTVLLPRTEDEVLQMPTKYQDTILYRNHLNSYSMTSLVMDEIIIKALNKIDTVPFIDTDVVRKEMKVDVYNSRYTVDAEQASRDYVLYTVENVYTSQLPQLLKHFQSIRGTRTDLEFMFAQTNNTIDMEEREVKFLPTDYTPEQMAEAKKTSKCGNTISVSQIITEDWEGYPTIVNVDPTTPLNQINVGESTGATTGFDSALLGLLNIRFSICFTSNVIQGNLQRFEHFTMTNIDWEKTLWTETPAEVTDRDGNTYRAHMWNHGWLNLTNDERKELIGKPIPQSAYDKHVHNPIETYNDTNLPELLERLYSPYRYDEMTEDGTYRWYYQDESGRSAPFDTIHNDNVITLDENEYEISKIDPKLVPKADEPIIAQLDIKDPIAKRPYIYYDREDFLEDDHGTYTRLGWDHSNIIPSNSKLPEMLIKAEEIVRTATNLEIMRTAQTYVDYINDHIGELDEIFTEAIKPDVISYYTEVVLVRGANDKDIPKDALKTKLRYLSDDEANNKVDREVWVKQDVNITGLDGYQPGTTNPNYDDLFNNTIYPNHVYQYRNTAKGLSKIYRYSLINTSEDDDLYYRINNGTPELLSPFIPDPVTRAKIIDSVPAEYAGYYVDKYFKLPKDTTYPKRKDTIFFYLANKVDDKRIDYLVGTYNEPNYHGSKHPSNTDTTKYYDNIIVSSIVPKDRHYTTEVDLPGSTDIKLSLW